MNYSKPTVQTLGNEAMAQPDIKQESVWYETELVVHTVGVAVLAVALFAIDATP